MGTWHGTPDVRVRVCEVVRRGIQLEDDDGEEDDDTSSGSETTSSSGSDGATRGKRKKMR